MWIVAAGRSANRAHLAAGVAAAFVRQGFAVSLCEIARNLPNVGYYFGLEPADYLATALDRRSLVTGTWNGSARFASSQTAASLERYDGAALQQGPPHAVIAAATSAARDVARVDASLESSLRVFSAREGAEGTRPDAILVASPADGWTQAGELAEALRARHPESLLLFLGRAAAARPGCADASFVFPSDLAPSLPRRSPPEAPLFSELVSYLVQHVGSRRRRSAGAANE